MLGRYRIVDLLGEGGMGKVYRAEDPELGREVAIKVLPAEVAGDPGRLARFRREARAVAALDHPGVVTIHSVESSDDVHFLTMELVAGEPLDLVIAEGGLPIERFFDIATTLAAALEAAHERGIVHRDIKPANVMIGKDGRTKVLDFGLARFVPEGPVSDFDRACSFYRDTLGLGVKAPNGVADLSAHYWVELDTGSCTLALHAGGQKRLSEDAPKIVFRVADVALARVELLSQGVPMGDIRLPAPGVQVCDGRDPEGNCFSIESRNK